MSEQPTRTITVAIQNGLQTGDSLRFVTAAEPVKAAPSVDAIGWPGWLACAGGLAYVDGHLIGWGAPLGVLLLSLPLTGGCAWQAVNAASDDYLGRSRALLWLARRLRHRTPPTVTTEIPVNRRLTYQPGVYIDTPDKGGNHE